MKIAVLVKEVPDASTARRLDPQSKRLDRSGEASMNPFDANAVEEGLRRCQQLLQQARGDRFAELTVQPTIAVLQAMQGRFREARDLIAEVPHLPGGTAPSWKS